MFFFYSSTKIDGKVKWSTANGPPSTVDSSRSTIWLINYYWLSPVDCWQILGNGTQQTVIVDAKRCVTRIGCRLSTVDRCQNSPLSKLKLINENFVDNPMNLIYIWRKIERNELLWAI